MKNNTVKLYNELHENFYEYININKLSKTLKWNNRTTRNELNTLKMLGLFNKPLCEYHEEESEVLK